MGELAQPGDFLRIRFSVNTIDECFRIFVLLAVETPARGDVLGHRTVS